MKWIGILFMAALLALAPSYGSAQQTKEKSPATQSQNPEVKGEPAGTAKSFTPAEKRAYEKKTAKELEAIQQGIADLRIKAATGSPQMKRLLIRTAGNLQLQKLGAETQLTTLKKASDASWGQQKAELDKSMEDLRRACKSAGISL
ncbi:MAG: hypothetical protein PHU44_17640 [Syntrophales bacterium]|nr:hypothetical protein [Syntrophales bacterium]